MSMVKCQSSNEIKIQIQKFIKKMNLLTLHHLAIHLTFACLPQAGILVFGIDSKVFQF
jgi:hypothetical protein